MYEDVLWNQWESLNSIFEVMKNQIKQEALSEKLTLENAVTSLQAFAKNQFEFFYYGFYGGDPNTPDPHLPYLRESNKYPPQNVLQTLLFQISHDILILRQIISQRRYLATTDENGTKILNKTELDTLKLADFLANQAIEPAHNLFANPPKAITYFQKSPAIRVIPYAPIALISIPYSCVAANEDEKAKEISSRSLLAIPHEVGHYLFWHGQSPTGERLIERIFDALPSLEDWAMRWVEEIFADVYGSMIAGPVIGLSAQDLQLLDSQEGFIKDDSEHPVPTLRPFVYAKVISKSHNDKWGALLSRQWNITLDTENHNREYKQRNDHIKPLDEAIQPDHSLDGNQQPVDIIISTIWAGIETIWNNFKKNKEKENTWKRPNLASLNIENVDQLYLLYNAFAKVVTGIELPEVAIEFLPENHQQPEQWQRELEQRKQKAVDGGSKILTKDWLVLFEANGWATRGPTDNPPIKTWIRF